MEVESKVTRTFLSGIIICVVSGVLLVLGAVGVSSYDANTYMQFFVLPSLFFVVGIMAIFTSRRNKKLAARAKMYHY